MKFKNFAGYTGKFSSTHYAAYYADRNETILKKYPRKRDKDEWSDRQRSNRSKFLLMTKFAKMNLYSLIRPIWNPFKRDGLNGYNRFMKLNKNAFDFDGIIRFPEKLVVAFGDLPSALDCSASLNRCKNVMYLKWKSNPNDALKRKYDHLAYVVYHPDEPLVAIHTVAKRWNDKATVELEEDLSEGDLLFIFFTNMSVSEFSCSFPVFL